MARLTVKSVEAVTPTEKRREIPDDILPGLYLILQPTGAKTWAVRYRLHGRSHKHTCARPAAPAPVRARQRRCEPA